MASIAASVPSLADDEVSLFRLYVLRAMYLVLVVGLGAMIVPELVNHELTSRGVIASLLGAVWVLAFLGLRYPLEMLQHSVRSDPAVRHPLGLCLAALCEAAWRPLALRSAAEDLIDQRPNIAEVGGRDALGALYA